MYKWQFSPVDSSLPFALTDCPASYSAAHISSYAADCCRRTKQLLLHVLLHTHCSRDTLSESSYKQKKLKEIIFLPCLVLREARTKHE